MLGPVAAEAEPAWQRALLLGTVYAVPYLFRCRAVMLSFIWVFGRVGLAWLVPVRPDTQAGCPHTACVLRTGGPALLAVPRAHAQPSRQLSSAVLPMRSAQ